MSGFNIGIGIGMKYIRPSTINGSIYIPKPQSCFGTGRWLNDEPWLNDDEWEMS